MKKGYTIHMRFGLTTAFIGLLSLTACSSEPHNSREAGAEPMLNAALPGDTPPEESGSTTASDNPQRVAVRHILLEFSDEAEREDAFRLASSLQKAILEGEDMALLAKKHSKDGTAPRGGFLGAAERGAWVIPFEEAAFKLEVGEVSGPVETEYGVHILRREALTEVKLMHLLVAHKDAKNVAKKRSPVGKRTREEAETMAHSAHALLEEGQAFSEVAAEFSDTPMAQRGAEVGWFVRGELGPKFDQVAFELSPDSHSAVFETVFGFHIIRRVE